MVRSVRALVGSPRINPCRLRAFRCAETALMFVPMPSANSRNVGGRSASWIV